MVIVLEFHLTIVPSLTEEEIEDMFEVQDPVGIPVLEEPTADEEDETEPGLVMDRSSYGGTTPEPIPPSPSAPSEPASMGKTGGTTLALPSSPKSPRLSKEENMAKFEATLAQRQSPGITPQKTDTSRLEWL